MRLMHVIWENGEGRMCETVGWEVSLYGGELTLATTLERHNAAEVIVGGTVSIPVDNIHVEQELEHRHGV